MTTFIVQYNKDTCAEAATITVYFFSTKSPK